MLSRLSLALIAGLGALAAVRVSGEAASCAPPLKVGEFTRLEAQSAKVKRCEDDYTTPESFLQISPHPFVDNADDESCKITTRGSNPNCVLLTLKPNVYVGCLITFNGKKVKVNFDEGVLPFYIYSTGCDSSSGSYNQIVQGNLNDAVINDGLVFEGDSKIQTPSWPICFTENSGMLSECSDSSDLT